MGRRIREFVAHELWLLIGIVTFAASGLAAVSGFGTLVPAIAVIGWFLLAPIFLFWGEEIAEAVFDGPESEPAPREPEREADPVDELKRRYAAGEIDDAEFERRLERLLDVEGALEHVFADSATGDASKSDGSDGGRTGRREAAPDAPGRDGVERDRELER